MGPRIGQGGLVKNYTGIGGGMFICPGFSWLVEMQVALWNAKTPL